MHNSPVFLEKKDTHTKSLCNCLCLYVSLIISPIAYISKCQTSCTINALLFSVRSLPSCWPFLLCLQDTPMLSFQFPKSNYLRLEILWLLCLFVHYTTASFAQVQIAYLFITPQHLLQFSIISSLNFRSFWSGIMPYVKLYSLESYLDQHSTFSLLWLQLVRSNERVQGYIVTSRCLTIHLII